MVAIENIKKKLTDQQLEMFRKSCLGKFLLLSELKFSTQIVHSLLLRQCKKKKENEIWMEVKSKGLRFGKDEFVLVIGLSFGPIPKFDKRLLRIREKYFKGEKKMCNDQLESVFLSLGKEKEKKKNNNKKQNKNERT